MEIYSLLVDRIKGIANLQLQSLDDEKLVTSYYLTPKMLLAFRILSFLWTLGIFVASIFTRNQLSDFGASLYYNLVYFTKLSW